MNWNKIPGYVLAVLLASAVTIPTTYSITVNSTLHETVTVVRMNSQEISHLKEADARQERQAAADREEAMRRFEALMGVLTKQTEQITQLINVLKLQYNVKP